MNTRTTLTDITHTLDNYDPDALTVVDAQKIIRAFVTPVQETETINIHTALGRTLAEDIISPINVPAHDNAAMDGYALRASDLDVERATVLRVIGIAYAGHSFDGVVEAGECIRIMTGALMPLHCDTVVPQEFTHTDGDAMISITAKCIKQGDHRRLRGESCNGQTRLEERENLTASRSRLACLAWHRTSYGNAKITRRIFFHGR
jgi:molybdopterin molybdotransferase